MVDVIQTERLLSYLEREWNSIPAIVRKWSEMDAIDQEILQLEWVLREQALDQLEIDVLAEGLAPQQKCRYRALLQLIEEMRPILRRLFESNQ